MTKLSQLNIKTKEMVVGFEISGAWPSLGLGSKSIGEMCTLLLSGFKSRDWLVYTAIYT